MRHLGSVSSPEKKISKAGPRKVLRFLKPYLWPAERPDLRYISILAIILTFIAKGLTVLVPYGMKWSTDALAGNVTPFSHFFDVSENTLAIGLAIGLVIFYGLIRIGMVGFTQFRDALYGRVGQYAVRKLSTEVFEHLHALSLRFHLKRRTGGLSRIIDRGKVGIEIIVRMLMINGIPTLIEFIVMLFILTFAFDIYYTLVAFITILSYVVFTFIVSERRLKIRRIQNESDNDANSKAIDSLLNFETVKYFNNENMEARRFDQAMSKYERATIRTLVSLSWLNFGQAFIFSIGLVIVMAMVGIEINAGTKTIGDFVMINAMFLQIWMPLNFIGFMYRELRQGILDIEQMVDILDQPPEIQDKQNAPDIKITKSEIEFKDVVFHYEPDRPILHGISFKVASGATTAIVGPSGAGKSTISRLLFRFYDTVQGGIYVDGQNIKDVRQDSLRRHIGMVPQDTVLFNDTILYNIAYGRPDATEEDVIKAAKMAQIHEFINRLPQGYDTMVGERGLKLSGGEKQRVAIARTILKGPPILILDEATSALDSYTEKEIQSALDKVAQNRTTLVIAHRLSTIVNADEIIVMEAGLIAERGTHEQLLRKNGLYAGLWNRQKEAEAEGDVLSEE